MTIKLHDLRPAPGSNTKKTRVGRGEGSKGKTAGRGTKGTKARKNVPVRFEGGQMPIHMRLPKLKGFRNRFRTEYEVVNVGDINRLFPEGGTIGLDELVAFLLQVVQGHPVLHAGAAAGRHEHAQRRAGRFLLQQLADLCRRGGGDSEHRYDLPILAVAEPEYDARAVQDFKT